MIRLSASLTKKVPHPVHAYGSLGASLSLEIECSAGQDPVQEAQRLFRQLDQAVDAELQRQTAGTAPQAPQGQPSANPTGPNPQPTTTATPARPGRPRGPAPITASQIRLLERLFTDQPDQREAVLARCRVQVLDDLTCRQASEAIDALKGAAR
jgi:hypothetical protein